MKRKDNGLRCVVGLLAVCLGGWLIHERLLQLVLLLPRAILVWLVGWSLIGVGAGLIMTRDKRIIEDKFEISCKFLCRFILHYVGYQGFVTIIAILSSLTASVVTFRELLRFSWQNLDSSSEPIRIAFYASAALTATSIGFIGEKLYNVLSHDK